ncbi:MAG: RNA-binding cell elongation regulator Jag/EloR [Anaerolineae bacterium]
MTENNHNREIESRGPDVEAAIDAGLESLGLTRGDVIIEIVDEGSRGLLGIGGREAVVRLTPLTPPRKKTPARERPAGREHRAPSAEPVVLTEDEAEIREQDREVAVEIIEQLLEKMQIKATLEVTLSKPDDLTGKQLQVIEIHGEDLGVLIGPRGETLNAFQYIVRLMAGHRLRRRVDFVIDVEGYRQRREQALSRLAERMAKKVASRKRPIGLEPMLPHERRIIHMTLRDHSDVYTESIGEGRQRKVRIIPK